MAHGAELTNSWLTCTLLIWETARSPFWKWDKAGSVISGQGNHRAGALWDTFELTGRKLCNVVKRPIEGQNPKMGEIWAPDVLKHTVLNLTSVEHPWGHWGLSAAAVTATWSQLSMYKDQKFLFNQLSGDLSLRYSSEYPRQALVSPSTMDGMPERLTPSNSPEWARQRRDKGRVPAKRGHVYSFMTISVAVCCYGFHSIKNIILNRTERTFCLRN